MNKTFLAIIAFFVLGGGVVYWNMTQQTPQGMGHSMAPPDMSHLGQGAPIVEVLLPTELTTDAQMGKRAYEAKCAECHGTNAAGKKGVGPPLVHKTYEPNHHSDMAFVLAAKNGVRAHHWRFGDMPPVKGVTDGDVKLIARYIRELQKENGIF
jgi:mono/diheme cytochrome c family protein